MQFCTFVLVLLVLSVQKREIFFCGNQITSMLARRECNHSAFPSRWTVKAAVWGHKVRSDKAWASIMIDKRVKSTHQVHWNTMYHISQVYYKEEKREEMVILKRAAHDMISYHDNIKWHIAIFCPQNLNKQTKNRIYLNLQATSVVKNQRFIALAFCFFITSIDLLRRNSCHVTGGVPKCAFLMDTCAERAALNEL